MIKAAKIILDKVTGLTSSLGKREYTGADMWKEANRQLIDWRLFVGSVDEVDFTVEYEDGCKYQGTIELSASDSVTEFVGDHIRKHCETYGGRKKPWHMKDEDYKEMLRIYSPDTTVHTRWLDNYEIGE